MVENVRLDADTKRGMKDIDQGSSKSLTILGKGEIWVIVSGSHGDSGGRGTSKALMNFHSKMIDTKYEWRYWLNIHTSRDTGLSLHYGQEDNRRKWHWSMYPSSDTLSHIQPERAIWVSEKLQ